MLHAPARLDGILVFDTGSGQLSPELSQLNLPGLFFAAQYSVTGQHEFTVVLGQVTPETRFCHFADTAYLTAGKLRGSVHLDRSAVFLLRLRPDAPETVALVVYVNLCINYVMYRE